MLLSKGDHTFVSAKEGYSSFIRSGNNGTTYQLMVTPSYLAVGLSGEMLKINSQKAEFNIYNENRDFVVNGSLDNLIYADASQNTIGINTDSPTSRLLTIRGKASPDNNAAVLLQGSGVGTTATDGFLLSQAHDGTSYVWNFETKPLIFANDNTERMRLESDGKLSHYGTAAKIADGSAYELDISNSAATLGGNRLQLKSTETVFNENGTNTDFRVEGDSDENLLFVNASTDRVGIGTDSPAYKLDVQQGSVRFGSGIAVASNTILAKTDENIQLGGPNIYDGWLIAHVRDCYGVGNNANDGLLIEKRDGNGTYPDGGIIFANRGSGGISNPSLSINGFGHVSIGKMVSPFLSDNNRLVIESGHFVFNGDNGNYDFKVHGDTDQNLLFCDASTDRVGIGTDSPTQRLDVNSSGIRIRHSQTPASGSAAGNQGDIFWDTNYVYICVETNTWKRSALSTF